MVLPGADKKSTLWTTPPILELWLPLCPIHTGPRQP